MTRYLISFDAHAMDHIPEEEMPAVAKAAHEVVDVPSREKALKWAARTAAACRCAQEVRESMPDPTVGN